MLAGLNPGERQAIADLQGDPSAVAGDTYESLQGATVDDMDLDLLQQRTNGDTAFFEEIRETLQPLYVCVCVGGCTLVSNFIANLYPLL